LNPTIVATYVHSVALPAYLAARQLSSQPRHHCTRCSSLRRSIFGTLRSDGDVDLVHDRRI